MEQTYKIGDTVLVNMQGAEIPGVIEDEENGQFRIRLSRPWANASGGQTDSVLIAADRLSPYLGEPAGTTQGELPD